jgi:hypothetical protein
MVDVDPSLPRTDTVAPPIVRKVDPPPACSACEADPSGGRVLTLHHELEDDLRALVAAQSIYIVELVEHLKTHDCEQVLRPVGVKRVETIDELRRKVGIVPPKRRGP